MTHGFVVEFHQEADRKHYLNSDEAHLNFARDVGDLLDGATVLDFTPGLFGQ